uniref:Uncharacterized protein n=1 Tax=Anguilla anguilla TaxID=7936 RepID=A0A0E9RFA5_ANGAN
MSSTHTKLRKHSGWKTILNKESFLCKPTYYRERISLHQSSKTIKCIILFN